MNSLSLSFDTNDSRPVSGVRLLPLTTGRGQLSKNGSSPRQEPIENITFPALSGQSVCHCHLPGTVSVSVTVTFPAHSVCHCHITELLGQCVTVTFLAMSGQSRRHSVAMSVMVSVCHIHSRNRSVTVLSFGCSADSNPVGR